MSHCLWNHFSHASWLQERQLFLFPELAEVCWALWQLNPQDTPCFHSLSHQLGSRSQRESARPGRGDYMKAIKGTTRTVIFLRYPLWGSSALSFPVRWGKQESLILAFWSGVLFLQLLEYKKKASKVIIANGQQHLAALSEVAGETASACVVCSAEALVTVTPVQLLLCAPLSLLSCLGDVCWSSYWNGAFPQFQSYLCPALQKASGALLSRKSVWLLPESAGLISLQNKALGLRALGGVAKEASLLSQKVAVPAELHLHV